MGKISYVIHGIFIDIRENIRMLVFSSVFSFMMIYFMTNIYQIKSQTDLLNNLGDVYFFGMENSNEKREIDTLIDEDVAVSHDVSYVAILLNDNKVESYIYDQFIMDNLNYTYISGEAISNQNEILISQALGNKYKVGDELEVKGYDNEGNVVCKTKTVCGVIAGTKVYYSMVTGTGSYEAIISDTGEDELYSTSFIITTDYSYNNGYSTNWGTHLLEKGENFNLKKLEQETKDYGHIYSAEEMIENSKRKYEKEIEQKMYFFIATTVLIMSIFSGNIYITAVRHSKELGVMRLLGVGKIHQFIMINFWGMVNVVIGGIIGVTFDYLAKMNGLLEGVILNKFVLVNFVIMVVLYLSFNLLINHFYKKQKIRDLIS